MRSFEFRARRRDRIKEKKNTEDRFEFHGKLKRHNPCFDEAHRKKIRHEDERRFREPL